MIPGDALQPIVDELKALRAAVDKHPRLVWATVTSSAPLRVRIDGDTSSTAVAGSASGAPEVGTRVYCSLQNGRLTVLSAPKPPEPDTMVPSLSRISAVHTVQASTWVSPMRDFSWEETVSSPDLLVSSSGGVVCQRAGIYRAEFYTYLQYAASTFREGMVGIMSGTGSPSVGTLERVTALGNWAGGHSFGQVSIEGPMEVGQRWVPWLYVDSATQTRSHKTVLSVRRIGDA